MSGRRLADSARAVRAGAANEPRRREQAHRRRRHYGVGLAAWFVAIKNVGGFVNAFSQSHTGGWDDSGYVRDSSLLLLSGSALLLASMSGRSIRLRQVLLLVSFAGPWTLQALLASRRGPTFAVVAVVAMGWFLHRNRRPPVLLSAVLGLGLGYLILFLVANRGSIHLGSDMDFKSDVTSTVQTADTGTNTFTAASLS